MTTAPRIGSLCSGTGGLEMGLQAVIGGTTVWHAEVDPAASRILAAHWPDVVNHCDITAIDWDQVRENAMPAHRKDEHAAAMYRRYTEGVSLATVASEFGISRQSVYAIFKRRSWVLHPRPAGRLHIDYGGMRYTLRNNGYYAATTGTREYLHRQVWIDAYGVIADGDDVHHRDRDKSNNDIANLEALPKAEHARLYGTGCNAHVHRCTPDCTEEVVPSDSPAVDWLTAGYP